MDSAAYYRTFTRTPSSTLRALAHKTLRNERPSGRSFVFEYLQLLNVTMSHRYPSISIPLKCISYKKLLMIVAQIVNICYNFAVNILCYYSVEVYLDIEFANKKDKKAYEKGLLVLQQRFGLVEAKKIAQRISELRAAENLSLISKLPPPRCHQLTNNRKKQFSVDVTGRCRMLFEPIYEHHQRPQLEDGGLDLKQIVKIRILDLCTDETHR